VKIGVDTYVDGWYSYPTSRTNSAEVQLNNKIVRWKRWRVEPSKKEEDQAKEKAAEETLSTLRKKYQTESLILAQDERWRRA
jgi:hypothetical protein